eukprot:335452_1
MLTTHIKCWAVNDNSAYFTSFNGKYDEDIGKFGADKGGRVNMDYLTIRYNLHQLSIEGIQEMVYLQSEDQLFRDSLQFYTSYLQKEFKKQINVFMKQKSLRKLKKYNYQVLVHMVTDPDSPQLWRRLNVNGSITMKQFDEILRESFHFGRHSSYFKIPLNNKYFNMYTYKGDDSKYIKQEIILLNLMKESIDKYCFEHFYKPFSMKMEHLLFGQIAPIFNKLYKKYPNAKKTPFDIFKQKYYPGFYSKYDSYLTEEKQEIFDFDARFNNFTFDRNDCFRWCYDLGDRYICNIYIENRIKNQNTKQVTFCEYINGETCPPPESMGGPDDWYKCILMCHGVSYKQIVRDFGPPHLLGNWCKNKGEFYDWLKHGNKEYYDIICLANKQRYLTYFGMNEHQFNHYIKTNIKFKEGTQTSKYYKLQKNFIKYIKSDCDHFCCPYLPMIKTIKHNIFILNDDIKKENENDKSRK